MAHLAVRVSLSNGGLDGVFINIQTDSMDGRSKLKRAARHKLRGYLCKTGLRMSKNPLTRQGKSI